MSRLSVRRVGAALTLTALLLVGVVGTAEAGEVKTLHGDVEPGGTVRVKIDRFERAGQVLPRFRVEFAGIPLQCVGGETETTDVRTALYRFDSDRDLDATVVTLGPGEPEYLTKLSVKMRINGNRRVEGTVRYLDRQFETAPGVTDECDSGRLSWEAQRPAGR